VIEQPIQCAITDAHSAATQPRSGFTSVTVKSLQFEWLSTALVDSVFLSPPPCSRLNSIMQASSTVGSDNGMTVAEAGCRMEPWSDQAIMLQVNWRCASVSIVYSIVYRP